MRTDSMADYWDGRAREDPFHYVDSRQPLGSPDLESFWEAGEEAVERLLAELGTHLGGSEDVVEIGCGLGRMTRALAQRARSVHALDVSEVMLREARRHNPHLTNVTWLKGDGASLSPLPEGSFDACVSFVVFQHLPEPELTYGYVREMGRVLRAGGWAAFQVSNDPRVHKKARGLNRLRQLINDLTGRGTHNQHAAWRGSAVDIGALRRAAAEGNMELERVEYEGTQFCLILARRRPHPFPAREDRS